MSGSMLQSPLAQGQKDFYDTRRQYSAAHLSNIIDKILIACVAVTMETNAEECLSAGLIN